MVKSKVVPTIASSDPYKTYSTACDPMYMFQFILKSLHLSKHGPGEAEQLVPADAMRQ